MTVDTDTALEAHNNLTWIAARWPALHSHLAPTTGNTARHTPTAKSKPPLNLHVLDLMHEIEETTRHYAHVLIDETFGEHQWAPTTTTMPGLLTEVAQRYGHWTSSDDEQVAWEFTDWAHDTAEKVRRVTEQPPPATWIGPCRNSDDPDILCRGHLYVRRQHIATCPECGATTDVLERREWMRDRLAERLMTRSEIAAALTILETPVKIRTIDTWIERRRLIPAIGDDKWRLYKLADAVELAERHKPRSREKISA